MAFSDQRDSTELITENQVDWHKNFCDSCKKEKEQMLANGFCEDCEEYLCKSCYSHHQRVGALSQHRLRDIHQVPTISQEKEIHDDIGHEMCFIHSDEVITHFCKQCKKLACHQCVVLDHQACNKVESISNIATGFKRTIKFKEFFKKLDDISADIKKYQHVIDSNVGNVDKLGTKAKTDVKKLRDEMNRIFDKLEKCIDSEIERIVIPCKTEMQNVSFQNAALTNEVETMKSEMEHVKRPGKECKLFTWTMKNISKQESIKTRLDSLHNINIKRLYFEFESSQNIRELMQDNNKWGELVTKPMHIQDINVIQHRKAPKDKHLCTMHGICLLTESWLVVAFKQHDLDCVKIIDIQKNKYVSHQQLQSEPYDVTNINDTQLAITLPGDRTIQLICVSKSGELSKSKQIAVKGECRGIAYWDGLFVITIWEATKGYVQILNTSGAVYSTFTKYPNGEFMFINPTYLTLSPDNSTIYVADQATHSVTSMTINGIISAIYKDDKLNHPGGVAVDKSGNVYVIGHNSNNIHQLTADCKKVKISLDERHGIKSPICICYNSHKNNILIGTNRNEIKVYELE